MTLTVPDTSTFSKISPLTASVAVMPAIKLKLGSPNLTSTEVLPSMVAGPVSPPQATSKVRLKMTSTKLRILFIYIFHLLII